MPHSNPFDVFAEAEPTPLESTKTVPNVFPRITNVPYRLAIIGEAPGADEVREGIPFVGYSGQMLNNTLSSFGIVRDACFIGNICQHRPVGNKIATFEWNGLEIQSGLRQLQNDLSTFRPNVVLCLGGTALHSFIAPNISPSKRKTKDGLVFALPNSIGDWRGSFFASHTSAPVAQVKCVASYHPAACLRQYEWTPLFRMDLKRAFDEATRPELELPQRLLKVSLSFDETVAELEKLLLEKPTIGTDIEGYWNNWSCISFAPRPDYSFIVPLTKMSGTSYWTVDEECKLLGLVAQVMADPLITKVWQNGLYDRFCMQYGYGIVCRGPNLDIMLRHWELYCELEKALSVQASIYTKEPYYKAERKTQDRETFWRYCCKDSAVTLEIKQKLDKYLNKTSQVHVSFNETLEHALLYMELRGIRYDTNLAKRRLVEIEGHIYQLQYKLNRIVGTYLQTSDKAILRSKLREVLCWKKDPSKVRAGCEADFDLNMRVLMGEGTLTEAEIGRLEMVLELGVNADSPDQIKEYLYEVLELPKQHHPQTKAVTVNYDAMLKLRKKSNHPSIPLLLELGQLCTRRSSLKQVCDPDGRMRGTYNEVGSVSGRVTCGKPPTGNGIPLQTVPTENDLKPVGHPLHLGLRDLMIADEGCYLAKCDLSGADGWTIGANLASLGDTTMLDDLKFGLKPAYFLCYERRHGARSTQGHSREKLREMFQEIKKSDWDYFASKQCVWGFFYLMGLRKSVEHVHEVSEGSVEVSELDMATFRDAALRRYNGQLWWRATEKRLFNQPYPPRLLSPSGHTRMFFGRRQEIVGEALAHEPQSVTTYATNQAVYRCWTDPENRVREGGKTTLRVEPLHQVHDEFLCQFKITDIVWATSKIKEWFQNPIKIAGVEVTIPFEGAFGTNWAMDTHSKKGTI